MRYGLAVLFFFQAEDGIRYLVRSRGLGDVYKRQSLMSGCFVLGWVIHMPIMPMAICVISSACGWYMNCLLYTSDAADERSSVDLGGRRIIKKKKA